MTAAARAFDDGDQQTAVMPPPQEARGSAKMKMPPAPPAGDLDSRPEPDGLTTPYDMPSAFEPIDDRSYEPTPALLAAKAEPLGGTKTGRPPARSKAPRSSKPPRAPRSGAGRPGKPPAGPSKARGRKSGGQSGAAKLLIGFGILAALAGGAAFYFFTQGDGGTDAALTTGEGQPTDGADGTDGVSPETGDATDPAVEPEATSDPIASPEAELPPVVSFDEAAVGPIQSETEYQVGIQGGPTDALYRILVDGEPQAEPAAELPPTVFAPGRHLLVIEITNPAGTTSTDPVVVYALGPIPAASYRANLSSVHLVDEGWGEAVRQFDEFVAAGHTDLELMPSDWFPSLVPGYWNLFVDGFETAEQALEYCGQHELAVPDDCFAVQFDPDAPAGG
jgi:hypothetical protein